MNTSRGRFGTTLARSVTAALAVLTCATALPSSALATVPAFNGTYTAIQKSFAIDPRTGARVEQPDQVRLWIVTSNCAIAGCTARAVKIGTGLDLVFDGTRWTQAGAPPIGTCAGVTVPARAAGLYLVPHADGSLSGAVTSTVDCHGATIDSSLPLTLTPS